MSDEMMSIAEVLAKSGFKPRPPNPGFRIDYAKDATVHWEKEKPRIWALLEARGVPKKLVDDLQSGTIEQSDSILAVERFVGQPNKLLLLLMGKPQVGKSLAAAYGLSTRTVERETQFGNEERRKWRYWDSSFAWIKANQLANLGDRFDPEVRTRVRRLETEALLVIDEVGGQTWADISKRIDDLIGQRWGNGCKTILTTNLDIGSLRQELSERVIERIRNVGTVVECRGLGEL